jgi:hypothetical protein
MCAVCWRDEAAFAAAEMAADVILQCCLKTPRRGFLGAAEEPAMVLIFISFLASNRALLGLTR